MYVGINDSEHNNDVNITSGVNEMLCMLESMIVNTTTGVNEMLCMLESMIQ